MLEPTKSAGNEKTDDISVFMEELRAWRKNTKENFKSISVLSQVLRKKQSDERRRELDLVHGREMECSLRRTISNLQDIINNLAHVEEENEILKEKAANLRSEIKSLADFQQKKLCQIKEEFKQKFEQEAAERTKQRSLFETKLATASREKHEIVKCIETLEEQHQSEMQALEFRKDAEINILTEKLVKAQQMSMNGNRLNVNRFKTKIQSLTLEIEGLKNELARREPRNEVILVPNQAVIEVKGCVLPKTSSTRKRKLYRPENIDRLLSSSPVNCP